ncbi:bifunctional diaminohydroxyphosphoribosylaminopyrimidine deaminase/5-amino-6-(5-phosphoribosylamino)uracil reductase RibD [Pediococcus siamensis]|uniref:bifunctional diaminohydroxyphosphoribosylaminopyrimidine deaminase/5-amino-6-(5-phosphoribosylamino)uracil reductase RibD n=1 Tax=Pediococcus siamensis TaxID=381829 RepID=UPI0039A1697A
MDDTYFMKLAFQEAKKARGSTWTNPLVGALIVKENQILSRGYHHLFGGDHAEVEAFKGLVNPNQAEGATMYVTLEPCSHYGKTPPCALKITKMGIHRVVIGQKDPNPLVCGKGIQILKEAGIQVTVLGVTAKMNEKYNFFYQQKRPFITLKYAMTLDGKINFEHGRRSLVSNHAAYLDSQKLRAAQQAILIGENTLMIDNPHLTIRTQKLAFEPIRILLVKDVDKLDPNLKIFTTNSPIWILSRHVSKRKWLPNILVFTDKNWAVTKILEFLTLHGIQSLLVEGGSHVQAAFVRKQLVDELVVYMAPKLFGGTALPAIRGVESLKVLDMKITKVKQLADNIRIEARRNDFVYRNY